MPIYEYACGGCGHKLEAIQKMSDDPLTDCPECNEAQLKKLVSAAGFRLKGNGWYETDFKGSKKSSGNEGSDNEGSKKSSDNEGSKKSSSSESSSAPASGTGGGCPATE